MINVNKITWKMKKNKINVRNKTMWEENRIKLTLLRQAYL